jgi:hypothetical protein
MPAKPNSAQLNFSNFNPIPFLKKPLKKSRNCLPHYALTSPNPNCRRPDPIFRMVLTQSPLYQPKPLVSRHFLGRLAKNKKRGPAEGGRIAHFLAQLAPEDRGPQARLRFRASTDS